MPCLAAPDFAWALPAPLEHVPQPNDIGPDCPMLSPESLSKPARQWPPRSSGDDYDRVAPAPAAWVFEYPWHTIDSVCKVTRGLCWRVEVQTAGKPWMPLLGPRSPGPAPDPEAEVEAGPGLIESWWGHYRYSAGEERTEPEVTEFPGRPIG